MSYDWNMSSVSNLLSGIGNDLQAALATATSAVAHVIVSPGAQPADDWCDCGQLSLWCVQKYRTRTFPNDDGSGIVTNCDDFKIAFDCRVRIARCVQGPGDNGEPPTDTAQTQDAVRQEQDGWVIWNTLSCILEEMALNNVRIIADWNVYNQVPVGPLGNCAGTETSFRFALIPQCCPVDSTKT